VICVRLTVSALLTSGIILLLLAAGCADVNVQKKVGDFGTAFGASSDEQKAIDWFKTTYGDPMSNNDQPARFVEPLITTGLDTNNMPKDKVTTFPVSGGSVYFFVIYDNFKKGDPITVSWTYLENGREVTNVQQQAGGDFGRFIVEFQKPDSGWGKGRQRITISGDGATKTVDFAIGDALQTTPLPYNAGTAGASVTIPGRVSPGAINSQLGKSLSGRELTKSQAFGHIIIPGTTTQTAVTTAVSGPDLMKDVNNCGKAGNRCSAPPNANPYCYQGQCTWDCFDEHRYCGDISEGCVPLHNYDNRCGNCNTECTASEYCNVNHCEPKASKNNNDLKQNQQNAVSGCNGDQRFCGNACVDTSTDSSNCGLCGFKCPAGMVCTSALCIPDAQQMCKDIPCPPLTHCEVSKTMGVPFCAFDF
jgi:hypothetical protein